MNGDYWQRTQRRNYFENGIEVNSGEVVSLVFRILPTVPIPEPDPAPIRLPVPVPAERSAAALIRQLGGWYELDSENHVVEVDMVSHEIIKGLRYQFNDRTDTDEALRAVSAFPRLKRLFLTRGQASDEGLRTVAQLSDLEHLGVGEATNITDAGVQHLAGLPKLTQISFSNGQLTDASLALFGRMPALTGLSLQGNAFSDEGLKQLAGLRHLQYLHLGMSRGRITDAGARQLAGLTKLEGLDLQNAELSDATLAVLKDLKQLRSLSLGAASGDNSITDTSVEHLLGMTKLRNLLMNNTRLTEKGVERLLALPELKDLYLSSSAIPNGLRDRLLPRRPGLELNLTRLPPKE
jgi:Leucine-rich repeat (LRR) protein